MPLILFGFLILPSRFPGPTEMTHYLNSCNGPGLVGRGQRRNVSIRRVQQRKTWRKRFVMGHRDGDWKCAIVPRLDRPFWQHFGSPRRCGVLWADVLLTLVRPMDGWAVTFVWIVYGSFFINERTLLGSFFGKKFAVRFQTLNEMYFF